MQLWAVMCILFLSKSTNLQVEEQTTALKGMVSESGPR